MSDTQKNPRWKWMAGVEVGWTRWGLGVEVSLYHWHPPELSVYIHVGPVLFGFGFEERDEWRYPEIYGLPRRGGQP